MATPHEPPVHYDPTDLPEEIPLEFQSGNFDHGEELFNMRQFRKIIMSLKATGPPGLLGWRPSHLKILIRNDRLLPLLYKWAIAISRDQISSRNRSLVFGLTFSPILYPETGKVRPVTCPDLWARAVGRCIAKGLERQVRQAVQPFQFAVGLSEGTGAATLLANTALECYAGSIICAADLENCFGEIDTIEIPPLLAEHGMQGAIPFFNAMYM